MNPLNRITTLIISAGMVLSATMVKSQNGEETFKKVCSACHSIGKGKLVGPDLKDVHKKRSPEWITKFVKSSQGFIASGDADAKAIFEEFNGMIMPDQNLPDADIKAIIAYIEKESGSAPATDVAATNNPEQAKPTNVATASNSDLATLIADGRAYFEGSKPFKNGGPSCISCHNVNYKDMIAGGVLAKDLTNAYNRLGGDAGLNAMLGAPPFPAMTVAFKNNPLTEEEIKSISAFLKDADVPNAPSETGLNPLLAGGFAGFVGFFALILAVWHKRKTKEAKDDYHKRQIQSIN